MTPGDALPAWAVVAPSGQVAALFVDEVPGLFGDQTAAIDQARRFARTHYGLNGERIRAVRIAITEVIRP